MLGAKRNGHLLVAQVSQEKDSTGRIHQRSGFFLADVLKEKIKGCTCTHIYSSTSLLQAHLNTVWLQASLLAFLSPRSKKLGTEDV